MNYPNGTVVIEKKEEKITTFANRGMDFEKAVNSTNLFYDDQKRAIITKRPTPIHIVKVDYQDHCRIKDAYFEKPRQIIMVFIVVNTLILNVKKLNQKHHYLSTILPPIKLNILKKLITMEELHFF